VVPAYNEAQSIGCVTSVLLSEGYSVVVVDDGSDDDTARVAGASGATVLKHCQNLGQGAALQTGIAFSLQFGAKFICTFDADGQHCVDDIRAMWTRLTQGELDIVLGSRFLGSPVGISLSRKLLLKAAVLFTRIHCGLKLTDTHNGLRLMRSEAASKLEFSQLGMAHATEILNQIAFHKLKYSEVPVTILYTPYSKAKGQTCLDSIRILADLVIGRMLR
jgi:glycosyltransferase involved in cell wall biosynthesis